ncbi:MAG TPA: ATP-binding cassette domain-containing protein [Chloroflexota bacterium]
MPASELPGGPGSAAAELRHATVVLGGRTILDDISLRIERGEFVAVLGANGAGKSTMLKALLGLIRPSSGSISVAGRSPRQGRSEVGYCPQVRTLDRETPLRGRDLVGMGLDGHRWGFGGIPKRERDARIAQVLTEVEALAFADAPVGQLSGGEQQRLAIAQALLSRPQLLLLDEPLSNLDVRSQAAIVALVESLRRQLHMAVVFVTHGINPLLGVIDRVCYLAGGRAAIGSVEEVIQSDVLSRLYGSPVEVVRAGGRIFVATDAEDTHA